MTSFELPPHAQDTEEPLWLTVEVGAQAIHCFEFAADCQRAVVVGSARGADVHVEAGPLIAFYVERVGGAFRLTPAYAAEELRVDTQRLDAPRELGRVSRVEFAAVSLVLTVRDTPPTLRDHDPPQDGNSTERADSRRAGEFGGEAVTAELPRLFHTPVVRTSLTAEYRRGDLLQPDACPTKTLELDRSELAQLLEPSDDEVTHPNMLEPQPTVELKPKQGAGGVQRVLPENRMQPSLPFTRPSPDGRGPVRNTDDRLSALRRTDQLWPPRPVIRDPILPVGSSSVKPVKTASHGDRAGDVTRSPIVLKPKAPPLSSLARLGLFTKRRPWLVIACASLGALVMALFLVGFAEVLRGRVHTSASGKPRVDVEQ